MAERTTVLIIPAAGSGSRLGSSVPKPFISIGGKTILEHTLSAFRGLSELREVIVAVQDYHLAEVDEMLKRQFPEIPAAAVPGGSERQHSIRNALGAIQSEARLAAVQDAVRPFTDADLIRRCLKAAEVGDGAIAAIPVRDTIKESEPAGKSVIEQTPDRSRLWQAQTPQVFPVTLLRKAYERAAADRFEGTDDASLVERIGGRVNLVEGDIRNIKITYPFDLNVARWILTGEPYRSHTQRRH